MKRTDIDPRAWKWLEKNDIRKPPFVHSRPPDHLDTHWLDEEKGIFVAYELGDLWYDWTVDIPWVLWAKNDEDFDEPAIWKDYREDLPKSFRKVEKSDGTTTYERIIDSPSGD